MFNIDTSKVALVSMASQNYWHPAPSIVFLKGVLNREGIQSTCFDLNHAFLTHFGPSAIEWCEGADTYSHEYAEFIEDYVEKLRGYDYIGASVFTLNSQIFTRLFCKIVRNKLPDAKIILGGAGIKNNHSDLPTISLNFDVDMIKDGLADYAITGEGDLALPALLRGEKHNFGQMSSIKNLPIPDYSDIDFSLYSNPTIVVTGSRGCVRKCTFCDVQVNWPKFRFRPGEEVAQEFIDQYNKYGIDRFIFSDSLVNGSMKEFRVFCRVLAEANLPIQWIAQFIFRSGMTDEDWDNMKASGCHSVWIGIESGSDAVRWHMKKKFSNEDMAESIEALGQRGIEMGFLLMVGYPTESEEDYEDTLQLLRDSVKYNKLIHVRCNIAMLLPDTEIRNDEDLWHGDPELWRSVTDDGELTYTIRYERWLKLHELAAELGYITDSRIEQQKKLILRTIEKEANRESQAD